MQVPRAFVHTTMLYVGGGVTASVLGWGGLLLKYYNKTSEVREKDKSINYLGWVGYIDLKKRSLNLKGFLCAKCLIF